MTTTRKQVEENIKALQDGRPYYFDDNSFTIRHLREYQSTLPVEKEPWEVAFDEYEIANRLANRGTGPHVTFRDGFLAGQQYEKEQKK